MPVKIKLEITWKPSDAPAVLAPVSHNGRAVLPDADDQPHGRGQATYSFTGEPDEDGLHIIQWRLFFDGTLTELCAQASLDGGPPQQLTTATKAPKEWLASGIIS